MRAAVQLQEKLDERNMSAASLARALGLERGVVARWLGGPRRPEPHLRDALQRLLGIKTADWMTDDEFRVAFGKPRARAA